VKKLYLFISIFISASQLLSAFDDDTASEGKLFIFSTIETMEIDGVLDEVVWQTAARSYLTYETQPGDLTPPPVQTKFMVCYDEYNLYIAFLCEDDPNQIRASLRDRDELWSDDFVGISLDTYGDASWSYFILANPLGIQGDGKSTNSNRPQVTFDIIYQSNGKITEDGYQVELAIPFSSLRFPNTTEPEWRINFFRFHPRSSQGIYSWMPINRDDPCEMCQFGTITGMKNIKSGNPLEFLPAVVASQSRYIEDEDDEINPKFIDEDLSGEFGIGIKWTATPSFTLEAAINPDFSQIESDATQIDVNTTYALRYPEKRPFFMEGSELFQTCSYVVYTRSINDPVLASKIIGRWGRTSIAYLGAIDENSPLIVPFEEKSEFAEMGRSISNIFRYKRTFGTNSFFGAMLTDRRFTSNGSGTNFGIDGEFRLAESLNLEWEFMGSYTQEANDTSLSTDFNDEKFSKDSLTVGFDGESFLGSAILLGLEREARHWDFDLSLRQYSPTFRADNGFIRSNSQRFIFLRTRYIFYPNSWLLDRFGPMLTAGRIYNYDGLLKDRWIEPGISLRFKGQTDVQIEYMFDSENFEGIQFDNLNRLKIEVRSDFSDPVSMMLEMTTGYSIARDELVRGKGTDLQFSASIKAWQRLIIQPSISYSRLDRVDTEETLFDGYIFRARFNFQFSRRLFLRVIFQYDDFDDEYVLEPLLSYKINPFSIFYIGSTQQYNELGEPPVFRNSARQYFLKFQYLFSI